MKPFFSKLSFLTIIIIVLAAISISQLDFSDLSWDNNKTNYISLVIAGVLLSFKYIFKLGSAQKILFFILPKAYAYWE